MASAKGYRMKRRPKQGQVWRKGDDARQVHYSGGEWIGFWVLDGERKRLYKFETVRQWDKWSAKAGLDDE